jgi:hypothetical protein
MAPGAEQDPHPALLQDVEGAHHVVDALDLVVDVLHAGEGRGEEGDLVMDLVDPQQRRYADAVADLGAHQAGPEAFVAGGVQGPQADMAEAGDAGVARREVPAAAVVRRVDQVDAVA